MNTTSNYQENKLNNLTDNEKKLRHAWMLYIIFQNLVSICMVVFNPALRAMPNMGIILYGVLPVTTIAMFYAMFRFIYQKHGTKFLTFLIVTGLLCYPFSIVTFIKNGSLTNFITIYSLISGIVTIVFNWKLRTINKKLQKPSLK